MARAEMRFSRLKAARMLEAIATLVRPFSLAMVLACDPLNRTAAPEHFRFYFLLGRAPKCGLSRRKNHDGLACFVKHRKRKRSNGLRLSDSLRNDVRGERRL